MTLPETDDLDRHTQLARAKLLNVLAGSWVAQGLYAVVDLGLPDLLADGPVPVGRLAALCDADEQALTRVLRALTALRYFTEPEPGVFGLTPVSDLLRTGVPGSVRSHALVQGNEIFRSFAEIGRTVRTGRPAFEHVYGQSFYDYLGEHPDVADHFNASMGSQPHAADLDGAAIGADAVVVDVGGGTGALLIELLRDHPRRRGVLVELPGAVRLARERLDAAGLAGRVQCVEGSFFAELPTGCDAYLLSRVLHNWTDDDAVAILRQVRSAMAPGSRLFICEDVRPEPGGGNAAPPNLVDLLMLVTLDGHDRTAAGYQALVVAAGFAPEHIRTIEGGAWEVLRT